MQIKQLEAFAYRFGDRSALEWVIDLYQVTTDKGSGAPAIRIVRTSRATLSIWWGRVIQVSVETVRVMAALPIDYSRASG